MRGKVVLLTGASSGIGAGTAVHLASRGCLLSLTGRNADNLQKTYKNCLAAGLNTDEILIVQGDLEKDEDIKRSVEETIQKFGKLDVLINNAGLAFAGSVQNSSIIEFDRTMRVNLRAPFILTQLCLPYLIQSQGNIVNVSSYFSTTPANPFAAYCMSKAGLDHLTRMTAKELGPKKVRVNSVNPGYVATDFQKTAGIEVGEEQFAKWHALGRRGTVDEVAKSICFLADNEQSSFVTGEHFYIDGGASLMGYEY